MVRSPLVPSVASSLGSGQHSAPPGLSSSDSGPESRSRDRARRRQSAMVNAAVRSVEASVHSHIMISMETIDGSINLLRAELMAAVAAASHAQDCRAVDPPAEVGKGTMQASVVGMDEQDQDIVTEIDDTECRDLMGADAAAVSVAVVRGVPAHEPATAPQMPSSEPGPGSQCRGAEPDGGQQADGDPVTCLGDESHAEGLVGGGFAAHLFEDEDSSIGDFLKGDGDEGRNAPSPRGDGRRAPVAIEATTTTTTTTTTLSSSKRAVKNREKRAAQRGQAGGDDGGDRCFLCEAHEDLESMAKAFQEMVASKSLSTGDIVTELNRNVSLAERIIGRGSANYSSSSRKWVVFDVLLFSQCSLQLGATFEDRAAAVVVASVGDVGIVPAHCLSVKLSDEVHPWTVQARDTVVRFNGDTVDSAKNLHAVLDAYRREKPQVIWLQLARRHEE